MKRLDKVKVGSAKLIILTPFLDVMTTLLIFLIITFAPDEAKIEVSNQVHLPESEQHLSGVPSVRIEVTAESFKLNGQKVENANPKDETATSWNLLKQAIEGIRVKDDRRILIVADKDTSFKWVDLTIAHLSAAGFAEIYLLTSMKQVQVAQGGAQ